MCIWSKTIPSDNILSNGLECKVDDGVFFGVYFGSLAVRVWPSNFVRIGRSFISCCYGPETQWPRFICLSAGLRVTFSFPGFDNRDCRWFSRRHAILFVGSGNASGAMAYRGINMRKSTLDLLGGVLVPA